MADAGHVVSIHRVAVKNGPAEPLAAAVVRANHGIEGDWRSRPSSRRQLTLVEEEALQRVEQTLGIALPPGASRRQIVVRGLPLNPTVGQLLRVGDLELKVTMLADPCNKLNRAIAPGARAAFGPHGGICARVLKGGTLRVGDRVGVDVAEPAAAA